MSPHDNNQIAPERGAEPREPHRIQSRADTTQHQTGFHDLHKRVAQGHQESPPVLVILEDGFTPVAAIQHMVNRARILHSQLSSHSPGIPPTQKPPVHAIILGTRLRAKTRQPFLPLLEGEDLGEGGQ